MAFHFSSFYSTKYLCSSNEEKRNGYSRNSKKSILFLFVLKLTSKHLPFYSFYTRTGFYLQTFKQLPSNPITLSHSTSLWFISFSLSMTSTMYVCLFVKNVHFLEIRNFFVQSLLIEDDFSQPCSKFSLYFPKELLISDDNISLFLYQLPLLLIFVCAASKVTVEVENFVLRFSKIKKMYSVYKIEYNFVFQ